MKFYAIPALVSALALAACGTPAEDNTTADETAVSDTAEASTTIVDVAAGNPDFSTLVSAVTTAELGETLSGEGPFTVFAPTNDAFSKVPAETMTALMGEDMRDDLVGILTYHVVAGKVDAATLTTAITDGGGTYEIGTVNGGKLTASIEGDAVILTDAAGGKSTVTATDVEASNGLIHVIDTVLMPK
ncbi:fasciclin domain-containing protein [Pontixanthobacter gangjinensis]|uniref:Fasciclin domain-containing protein n=1 Tax=Pontixanthobacter gangjinensis TaxID=1028742 RepID=A0A6I4SM56_9SPHN|nr:fasciclin domain-containing protein [Pontixanthobacter gangjinensis]MXO56236.1 fasciclin domain-containing protein [Pontixanthobacter gangjinensis]